MIPILHEQHHDTHTGTKKKMQIAETFRDVAIELLKRVLNSNFCSLGEWI